MTSEQWKFANQIARMSDQREAALTKDVRNYVRSLVRMDIRRKQKGLERFRSRAGQSEESAAAVRAEFEANVQFREKALGALNAYTPRRYEKAMALLAEAVAFVERQLAHQGRSLTMDQLQREIERMRGVAIVTVAHHSADIGVSFHLSEARRLLAEYANKVDDNGGNDK